MINIMVKSNNRSTATQQIVIYKLTQLLYRAKESFLDGRTTRAVLDHVYHNLGKVTFAIKVNNCFLICFDKTFFTSQQPLSSNDSRSINHSLLLIRNILHVTERPLKKADNVFHIGTAVYRDKQDHEPHFYKYNNDNLSTNFTQQDQLMRNLFAQGLDRLLVNLLACAQKVTKFMAVYSLFRPDYLQ
jgi:timeless protein